MQKLAVSAVVATALALAGAAPVLADGPTITTSTQFVAPTNAPQISAACGFTVLQTFTLERRIISFTDDSGALVRRITHASFEGSLIKAATGEALPWRGVWTQTLDVAAGTITIDGLRQDVQRDGEPPAAVMVGHFVAPAANFPLEPPIEESTRADFFDWWAAVCPVFAS
jgi:hypothetical protein